MRNDTRYDAISFDLDGTLVDTAGEITEAVNRTLAEFEIAPRSLAEVTGLIGNGLRELMIRQLARIFMAAPLAASSHDGMNSSAAAAA